MLKPVDLQTIMPRSVDLQKIQHVNNTRYVTQQQEIAKQMVQESQLRREQVQQNEASANSNRIRDDQQSGGHKGRKYRRFGSDKKRKEKDTEEVSDKKRGNIIDIKI
ncbi:MAG: hypothetical protein GXY86_10600 [Firmicutes bacterium]|mgnify:CR=1 FL=1|nr:hypothetical protein [Bacillota bacterium]